MSHNSENTDKYFRERLDGYEQSPPETAWDNIAQRLGKRKRKGMLLLFVRIAAGMALIVSTGYGVYKLTRNVTEPVITGSLASDNIRKERSAPQDNLESVGNKRKSSGAANKAVQNMEAGAEKSGVHHETPTSLHETISSADHDTRSVVENEKPFLITSIVNKNLPSFINNYYDKGLDRIDKPSENNTDKNVSGNLPMDEYADLTVPEKAGKDRWSMGSELAPLYSYRSISSDDLAADQMDNLNEAESGILSYAGGIHIAYSPGKRLSVQSGIYYSRYGQDKNQVNRISNNLTSWSASNKIYNSIAITNSTGEISGGLDNGPAVDYIATDFNIHRNLTESYGMVNTNVLDVNVAEVEGAVLRQYFDYFELPLIVKYKFIDKKMDFNISGGLVTNFLIGNSVKILGDENSTSDLNFKTTDISQINYVGSVGLGVEYPLASKLAFTLEPRFRYYINPIDKTSVVVHPFSFGIFGGFNYRF